MLNISFNFDESTHKISNLNVKEIKKYIKPETYVSEEYDLEILDNKIQLSPNALVKLNAVPNDRITINYWYVGPNESYPIISKADVFDNGVDGNRLTKSKTFSFRGEQRDILLKFGTKFIFEEWRDNDNKVKDEVFRLVPVNEDASTFEDDIIKEEEAVLDNMDPKDVEDDANWLLEL